MAGAQVPISGEPAATTIVTSDLLVGVIGGATKKITAGNFRTSLFGFAAADPLNCGPVTATGNSTITGTLSGVTTLTCTTLAATSLSGILTTSGAITMTAAASQIIPGATSFSIRTPANSGDNLLVTAAGAVTTIGPLSNLTGGFSNVGDILSSTTGNVQIRTKDTSQGADAKEWTLQNVGSVFRVRAVNDAVSSGSNAMTITRSGASPALMALMPDGGQVSVPAGSATNAGLIITPRVGDPSAPSDGETWITTTGLFKVRANGSTKSIFFNNPQSGYTNPWTGTLNRATAYDASTVTLVQLAQRVAAMQADLTTLTLLSV